MKPVLLLALLLWQSASPANPAAHSDFRYRRTISVPASSGTACIVLDPAIFPHAAPSLKDLRLTQGPYEIPYVITLSEPQQPDPDPATVRNLSLRGRNIVFDLEMPHRPYTDVVLSLAGHDFLATATVFGTRNPDYTGQTELGQFTLFDLTSQRLSRSSTLHLQETDLPYLHIELAVSPAPGSRTPTPQTLLRMVQGATVPPSREAQSLYSTAAFSSAITHHGHQSVASFNLPERIPIERVSFDLDPTFKSNFSRDIHISDHPNAVRTPLKAADSQSNTASNQSYAAPGYVENPSETLAGTIFRVHLTESGREIRQQQLSVPATLGSNMQSPATVEVIVDNGDDPPLPLTAIRLESRQRKLCFDASTAGTLTLFYGDPTAPAPKYEYARLWNPSSIPKTAQAGPEQLNPAYEIPPDTRPVTERHPHLLWVVLLAVLCLLGTIALRSSRTLHR